MTKELRLLDMQEAAAERGEPEVICANCVHFYIRTDGPTFMGRCAARDEPQFQYGVCLGYELPADESDPDPWGTFVDTPPVRD